MKLREKVDHFGIASLNINQLFMLIIGSGTKDNHVNQIVAQLAFLSANFTNLTALTTMNLLEIPGIGKANQGRILAVIELCQRLNHHQRLYQSKPILIKDISQHLIIKYKDYQQEELTGFFLDVNHYLLAEKTLFRGTLTSATVHPRDIMRLALRLPCAHIIVAHNHPSGNLQPSQADIIFTRRLQTCCQLFNISLIDHLIIGQTNFLSISDGDYYNKYF